MRLDKSQPYATVYGSPGISFVQEGVAFNASGAHVHCVDGRYVPVAEDAPEETPVVTKSSGEDWRSMSDELLKGAVKVYGGTWQGRSRAIAFLEGAA